MILNEAEKLFAENKACVLITIASVQGSTPRNQDAWMLVSETRQTGTIGGGQLEFLACQHAEKIIQSLAQGATNEKALSIALGPELGQCCGGRVELAFRLLGASDKEQLLQDLRQQENALPRVLIFGAGHVGLALTRVLTLLPVHVSLIDTRKDYLDGQLNHLNALAGSRLAVHATPLPEVHIRDAQPKSAFVVTTHDHGLDFMLTREALLRDDAAYIGLIGSRTKRASFINWLKRQDDQPQLADRLICPIGGSAAGIAGDKRPEVIALATAQELFSCF